MRFAGRSGRGSVLIITKRKLASALASAAILLLVAPAGLRAGSVPEIGRPPPTPLVQITGRVLHTWYESPDLRVILIIDGFTVLTGKEQLVARDGVVWFDEAEARRTGKAVLGVYAETGVEYKDAAGRIEKYDSVYLVMETAGEVNLHCDGSPRGKADSTELYLRARKLRKEYLASGQREGPVKVIPPPASPKPPAPGVREAGVPMEISIQAQDDVRQVNFTSFVEDGMRVSIWSGGVYVTRGDMELAADNLVIWMPEEEVRQSVSGSKPAAKGAASDVAAAQPGPADQPPLPAATADAGKRRAAEAYFEGHVRLTQGRRTLTCSQLYYDFQREQALAVDTKIKTFAKDRNIPVYYYAKEVRQLAKGIFVGTNAWMTTCEFAHPHYDMGAKQMRLTDLTPEPGQGEESPEYRRVRFVGQDVQARVRHVPLTYWPRLAGDIREAETALRTIRIENRSNRGTGLVTQWHLLKLLGLEREPPGFSIYLDADVWSERGPALGIESEYQRQNFFGEFLTYFIRDSGKDSVGGTDVEPGSPNRGRVLWRHRQYLPKNWELTLELSKITDRNFLNEFYEREDETGKTQESVFYLKKQEQDQALTILASARLNDWQTQTEFYPQIGYNMIGHSLWKDHLTYFQDSEVSVARFRPGEEPIWPDPRVYLPDDPLWRNRRGSGPSLIADTIHEVDLPLKVGVVNVVPFVEGRLSYFGKDLEGGSEGRVMGRAGARAATHAWRVYDNVESDFWDLHRLRHVNIFDVSAYAASTSVPSRDLFPYDVTEAGTPLVQGVDGTGVVELGWRQRLQTKRGPPGKQKSVDWLTMDLEATFYADREPPEIAPDGKRAFNHLDHIVTWQVSDAITVWTDTNFNLNDGTLDVFTVGATVTHTPRLTYSVGHRYIPDADSAITFFGFDYQINEKWRIGALEQYDFDRGQQAHSSLILTRRLHRWFMRIKLELDPGEDETFVGLEFQPLGVSEIQFGG